VTPGDVWAEVTGFLGISEADVVFEKHNARPRSKLDPALRDKLRSQFEESDERLAQWWGRTPSWRR
jgi:hypothetical protein